MILLLAGVPGVGKSHLAAALAPALNATILNRDAIRDALFLPQDLDYSPQQNHIATRTLLQVAEFLLDRDPARVLIFDGRPMSRASQIDQVAQLAQRTSHRLCILHCIASPELIAARLNAQMFRTTNGPIDDRLTKTIAIARDFAPITRPHLTIDTARPAEENVARVLAWLKSQK